MLDPVRRELWRAGALVAVEPQVFDLLVYLVENRDLLEAVWGGRIVSESTLTTHINATRRALGRSRAEAKVVIETWRRHYNEVRPHSTLGYLTPAEFVAEIGSQDAASRPACKGQAKDQPKGGVLKLTLVRSTWAGHSCSQPSRAASRHRRRPILVPGQPHFLAPSLAAQEFQLAIPS